jgi:hypothetical protein
MEQRTLTINEHETPKSGPTGPRTGEGKAISSQNALKHGLTAAKPENAVAPTVRAQYEAFRRQYLDDFRPQGAIENTLMDMVILAAWQLYKIKQLETFAPVDLGLESLPGKSLKLARYRASNERLLFRSLAQLRAIQQERALRETDRTGAMPSHLAPGVRLQPIWSRLAWLSKPRRMTAGVAAAGPNNHQPGTSPSRPPRAA